MLQTVLAGSFGGLVAALATTLGALPALGRSEKKGAPLLHISLDFALGMMLAAAAFSMIGPAGLSALEMGPSAMLTVIASIGGGVLFISGLGRAIARGSCKVSKGHGALLFIIAMMLHNFPEGLASGAAWAGLSIKQGLPILSAIALQNFPEGLMTALAFRAMGASTKLAFLGAVASAGVEFIGGGMGGLLLAWVHSILPYVLGFAGGAMLFVSIREVKERYSSEPLARFKVSRDLAMGAAMMMAMSFVFG